jgi:hypothetical protein
MPKHRYALALACYLLIPVLIVAGVAVHSFIDPEWARSHADYARDYRLLDLVRNVAVMGSWTVAFLLWIACCHLVLESRRRSAGWLALAIAGPFGFVLIAALKDRSPAADDLYQQFIGQLKMHWRILLEIALFFSIWTLCYEFVVLKRELMIRYESFMTGTPISTIVDTQNASSGMWAAGEGMEQTYLFMLAYLLWPVFFNLSGRLFKRRSRHPT